MQLGDTILILPSCALKSMHLEKLAGKRAKIVEIASAANRIYGCWVELPTAYLDEKEWFIPYDSIGQ